MSAPQFSSALARFQFRWRFGLLLAGFLRALFFTALALLLFGVLDRFAGFSDTARGVIARVLLTIAGAGTLLAFWRTITFMRRDAATEADRALTSPRREVLSALELKDGSAANGDSLGAWLRGRAVATAANRLSVLPLSRAMPMRSLRRHTRQLLAFVALFGLCTLIAPRATWTIARRLLQPGADIPPYSPLIFVLAPRPAEVLYGGELLVTAEIRGGKIDAPVRCLTRDPASGRVEESLAFQENPGRFSAKLEKLAAPVDVAFAVGRARSPWLAVAVRMQPKVQEVLLTIEPPAYSGLPRREFAVGAQDLAALSGSRITARITSNRPLRGGTLRFGGNATDPAAHEIAGEREETHQVRFSWVARTATPLRIEIRDILGTSSEPLQIEQKILPDERPEVVLRQPAGDVLATPDSELPFEATASDDLGLTRVAFVRQLHGYRERSVAQPVQPGQRRHELAGNLKLAPFALVPGQVIQLTLEAGDTNPNLLGVNVSEPARIHIIAREQYAAILRAQTTLEEFSARYTALNEAMNAARKAIDNLEQAARSGDAAKAQEARQKAAEAHAQAAQLFGRIAKDFPIFDLDPQLASTAADAMQRLFANGQQLESLQGESAANLGKAVPELKKRLGEMEQGMSAALAKGERAVAAGKVFEQAGIFGEVLAAQRDLVKDFNRLIEQLRRGEMQAGQGLRELAKQQGEVAEILRQMEKNLSSALAELPPEFDRMKDEGAKFLEALAELKIPPVMDEGKTAGAKSDSKIAGDRAGEALARLEALLRKKNGICAMCRGGEDLPFPWPEDLASTLDQLMRALIPKPGGSGGSGNDPGVAGSGPGFSGWSESGFAMRGKMPQLPIYGPGRARFNPSGRAQTGTGKGTGDGAGDGTGSQDVKSSQLAANAARNSAGEALATEAVPEAYRAAVKRYFSTDENSTIPAAAPSGNIRTTRP